MNYAQPIMPIAKAFFEYKKVYGFAALYMFFVSWAYTSVSLCFDDDLLIGLPFIVGITVIVLIVFACRTSKTELNINADGISGKEFFGKAFAIPAINIRTVQNYGINGINIIDSFGKMYKLSYIANRDEVCTALSKIGVAVDMSLISDENAVMLSTVDAHKQHLFKIFSAVSMALANVFITISAIWFNSPGNSYYYEETYYTYVYGYQIPYTVPSHRISWWPEEMFTTYIAMAFALICIVLAIIYFVYANNRVSISPTMFRGVNGFGKVSLFPCEQITGANIASGNSSLSVNRMGKVHKYYWLKNYTYLCATIGDIKTGKFNSFTASAPVPPVANEPVFNNAPVTEAPMTEVPVTETPIAEAPVAEAPVVTNIPQSNDTDAIEEIKKFKALLDEGIISEEEFDAKKKQLLNL